MYTCCEFASNIVSLTYRIQHAHIDRSIYRSCKLLSKLYLWHIEYSSTRVFSSSSLVVNCFQNCIFDISNTVCRSSFNQIIRCKLLSKLYLWHIEYSSTRVFSLSSSVVNCFQNCIFDISNTVGYIQYAVFQEFESKIRIEKVFE